MRRIEIEIEIILESIIQFREINNSSKVCMCESDCRRSGISRYRIMKGVRVMVTFAISNQVPARLTGDCENNQLGFN